MNSFVDPMPVLGDRLSRVLVEETISIEVSASTTERRPNPSASGFVRSHPGALTTRDTTFCLPDFLPIGGVAFPEALLRLWRTVRFSSQAGLFPSLSRMWVAVDNKLILWDYRDGREFTVCDEIPELIVTVGNPVRPMEGVFQPHVTLLLPVATSNTVFLLGLCVVNEEELSNIKIMSLGYSTATPTIITKITGASELGRIFCAGADGEVYEVRYLRESTPFVPKIRLVCFSYLFSSRPIVGQITSVIHMAREVWTGRKHGLRDVVVDGQRSLVVTLDEKSTIAAWRIVRDGLRFAKSLKHHGGANMRFGSQGTHSNLSPLVRLFLVEPDQDGCTLVAIALNGDQFRYRYQSPVSGGDFFVDLNLRSVVPSYFPSSAREVGVCFASGTTVIIADCTKRLEGETSGDATDDAEDELVVSTSPRSVMEPHSKYRDIVATFGAATTTVPMVRVDTIDAVPAAPRRSPNDLCGQVCHPPPLFIVLHRHGLAFYLQMRPVDTLFTIISKADAQCRDALLQRFASTYDATDYATMLLQVAVGGLNAYRSSESIGLPASLMSGVGAGAQSTKLNSPLDADGLPALEYLGRNVMEGDSPEARRLARDLLKSMATCSTQVGRPPAVAAAATSMGDGGGGGSQITLIMSPFASSVVTFLARALYSVWEVPIYKLPSDNLVPVEEAISLLIRFLEGIEVPSYSEESLRIGLPHQWQQGNRVVVSLSSTGAFSSLPVTDVTKLQMTLLLSTYHVARKAVQSVLMLRKTRLLPLRQEDRLLTVAQIVRDRDLAQRLGQYFGQVVLSSQQGLGAAANERLQTLAELQKECPYCFSSVDMQEYQAKSEIESLTRGTSLGAFSEAELAQWTATVAPNAAAYWSSGALQTICQQLNQLKREDVSVRLLLHAAHQLDPNNAAFASYLAQSGDSGAQVDISSGFAAVTAAAGGPGASVYQTKTRVVGLVTATLEMAWQRHRSAVEGLLGGPRVSGSIWLIEPSDEMTHCMLFDWLRQPRADAAMTQILRDTLVVARSSFLEKYLLRNRHRLGEEYARFLRRSQHNYRAAIEQCVLLAQSPLPHIPVADRLAYRVRCLNEAVECARECQSDQLLQVEQRLKLLEAQQRLVRVIADFLGSGAPSLSNQIRVEGRLVTERELSLQHIDLLSSYVITASVLLQIAAMYSAFGGAEVQLDVLASSNVSDPSTFAVCIMRAYDLRGSEPSDITRRLVAQYYRTCPSFPISFVIRMEESYSYAKCPRGTDATVRLFTEECSVDPKILFYAYQDILESKEPINVACTTFQNAGVTRGYLIHSMAVVMHYLCIAARRGTLQAPVAAFAIGTLQEYIAQAAAEGSLDDNERHALSSAEALLRRSSVQENSRDYSIY